jgi:hypothetical protein
MLWNIAKGRRTANMHPRRLGSLSACASAGIKLRKTAGKWS